MSDINKLILNERMVDRDPDGNLDALAPWSEDLARERAEDEGLELTPEHWEVIHFLRDRFAEQGAARSGRVLAQELDGQWRDRGGRRHLYQLFPNGPVNQGSRLAGLPEPAYTTDPSFGSVE